MNQKIYHQNIEMTLGSSWIMTSPIQNLTLGRQRAQRYLRYLRGTSKLCICFGGSKPILEGIIDANMARDNGRKSTSGFLFTFVGGAISWQSKL